METIETENTFAIIIAIEEYRFNEKGTGIVRVKYAENDARKFKKLLLEEFGVPEDNITTWINPDAIKSAFEEDLPYHIRQLTEKDRLIFYYAGHGFYQSGQNRLTCWDTHPSNYEGTTVSIKEVLLDPLERSNCKQSLIFLDCCSTHIKDGVTGRDLLSNFNDREFETFIKENTNYCALFMSCSPGEKSHSDDVLKNGIWTHHVIEALKGNVKEVITRERYITDNSIKNYLTNAIPKYITKNTLITAPQKPYSKISASGDFLIRELPIIEDETDPEMPVLKLDFSKVSFRKITTIPIKKAQGFKKTHFIPDRVNSDTNAFTQKVFLVDLQEEIQEIYENTKTILGLRKRHIDTTANAGSGSVECEFFRYFIDVEQSPAAPSEAKITRRLIIRVARNELVGNFDEIFPKQINEIVIPFEDEFDFNELVERFENLKEIDGGHLYDNEMEGKIEYTNSNGVIIKLDMDKVEMMITTKKNMKCLELIDYTMEGLKKISSGKINLLKG